MTVMTVRDTRGDACSALAVGLNFKTFPKCAMPGSCVGVCSQAQRAERSLAPRGSRSIAPEPSFLERYTCKHLRQPRHQPGGHYVPISLQLSLYFIDSAPQTSVASSLQRFQVIAC